MALLVSQSFGSFCTKSSLSIFRFLKTLLVRADLPDMEAVSMLWNIFTKSFLILYSYLQIVLILETFWKCSLNNHFKKSLQYLLAKKERKNIYYLYSIPPSGNLKKKITMFSVCYVYIKIFLYKISIHLFTLFIQARIMIASTQGYLQSGILIFLFFVSFRFYCCIVKFLSTSFLFTHISYLIKNIHVYYYSFMTK